MGAMGAKVARPNLRSNCATSTTRRISSRAFIAALSNARRAHCAVGERLAGTAAAVDLNDRPLNRKQFLDHHRLVRTESGRQRRE